METRWLYRTANDLCELREEAKGVCVLPIGCVEKHGLHLPLGQDSLQAEAIAYAASQIEPVCVFPTFTFGDLCGAAPSVPEGTVTLPEETLLLLLEQLCGQISRSGFHKIIIFNCHGGNFPLLALFTRMLANKKRDYIVAVATVTATEPDEIADNLKRNGRGLYPELTTEDEDYIIKFFDEGGTNGHAGFGEVAYMMAIAPEAVHLDRLGIESGASTHKADFLNRAGLRIRDGGWEVDFPNAYDGTDPVGCNERMAKCCFRLASERLAYQIKVLKEENETLKWLEEYQRGW